MNGTIQHLSVRVTQITDLTPAIKRFRLEGLDGQSLPVFSAGAHITVEIPNPSGVHRNAYSLCSSPRDPSGYEIGVLRDDGGRGGSRLMHEVKAGMQLRIGAPVNLFPLANRARKHLLIAGGIGITPFIAMTDQLLHDRVPFELHYAIRSAAHGAFLEDIRRRCERKASLYIGEAGQRLPVEAVLRAHPLGTHLYVCGPARLIHEVSDTAQRLGWPKSAVHVERFTAPPLGKPYNVYLERSGMNVRVGANESMLEAVEAAGVSAPYLCRGGACGQCATRVVACKGRLLHADHVLTGEQRASGAVVLPCVSRFAGESLVLDL